MKRILVSTAFLALAGCLSFPTTPDEVRSHGMTRADSIQVARSASSAFNTITSRARYCMNFGVRTQITRIGGSPGQGMNAIFNDSYRTRTEKTGPRRTLIVEHYNPANVGNPGWYPRIVADVVPSGGGALVTTHAPVGDGVFTSAIKSWALGNTKPCPRDDL